MLIADLGLRPCLRENAELSKKLDLAMIQKIHQHITQAKDLKRRKKKLKKILDKIDDEI